MLGLPQYKMTRSATFTKVPLRFDGKCYRIPDPNLSSVFGQIVPHDIPLEASSPEIDRRFAELVGHKVSITGTIQGCVHDWFPTSGITGIRVAQIELATNQ